MPLMRSIQKGASDFSFIIGTGLKYGGAFGLFAMAVVGTVAIDIVILAALTQNNDRHSHGHSSSGNNSFVTGYILGSMFSQGNTDFRYLLIASPITSLIAVALSFALGVPGVGVGILIGWGVAATLLALGLGLEALSKSIDPEPSYGYTMSPA